MKRGKIAVIVGAQWGDEGKGKLRRLAGVTLSGAKGGACRRNPERSEGTHEAR